MDLPANNRSGYRRGSILPLVSQFPNEYVSSSYPLLHEHRRFCWPLLLRIYFSYSSSIHMKRFSLLLGIKRNCSCVVL